MSLTGLKSIIFGTVAFLAKSLNLLGMFVLLVMMLLTVSDVFLRYFFNSPIMGGTEITEFIMTFMFLGVPWCAVKGKVIKMNVLASKFPVRVQAFLDATTDTMGLVVMALLSWQLFEEMINARSIGITSTVLQIPSYPFYGGLAIGVTMFCIVLVMNITQNIIKGAKP